MRSQQRPPSSEEEVLLTKTGLPAHNARWGIHYSSPALMVGLFVVGLFSASCHDAFYQSPHNNQAGPARDQQWAIRTAMCLAFVTKASFAASIGTAFTQYLWVVTRRQYMSLSALDAMFSLSTNPTSFSNLEVFTRAKVLFLLAGLIWLMPLLAMATPGTLSIRNVLAEANHIKWVPQLDFPQVERYRPEIWYKDRTNPTVPGTNDWLYGLLLKSSLAGAPIPIHQDYEPSYSLASYGPALKCLDLSDAIKDPVVSNPGPLYDSLQQAWDDTDLRLHDNHYKGAMNELANNYIFIRTVDRNITCNLWNASYESDFSSDYVRYDSVEYHRQEETHVLGVRAVKHIAPTNYSAITQAVDLPPGGRAYQAMFLALSGLLATELGPGRSVFSPESPLASTSIARCPDLQPPGTLNPEQLAFYRAFCPGGDVTRALEQLSHNFTMSIFSSRSHCVGLYKDVQDKYYHNIYNYDHRTLMAVYLIGAGITFCCLLLGLWSMRVNGYCANNSFSTILFTTRNQDLDGLAAAHCLGSSPLPKDVGGVKLSFGNIGDDHIAFGLADTVTTLRRGQTCH